MRPKYQHWFFFIYVKNIIWRTEIKSSKIPCRFKTWMRFAGKYWLSWKRLSYGVFIGCRFDVFLWVRNANLLVATHWSLKRAPLFQHYVCYGGLEAHWSYLCGAWCVTSKILISMISTIAIFTMDTILLIRMITATTMKKVTLFKYRSPVGMCNASKELYTFFCCGILSRWGNDPYHSLTNPLTGTATIVAPVLIAPFSME